MSVTTLHAASLPRVLHCGESFITCRFPAGTRVVYPPPPLPGLGDVDAAIARALDAPLGSEPLAARLRPGMKVTIAIDDLSVPLPRLRAPDVRGRVLEQLAAAFGKAGVHDVHVIVATGLHRRMTAAEIRAVVGPRIFAAWHPARLYNHDAEAPDGMAKLGVTRLGEPVEINRRAAESDLVIYVNVNFVPMNGGHKSLGVGLGSYRSISAHHNPETLAATPSYMAPESSKLHAGMDRIGRVVEERLQVFKIEVALNNRMYGPALGFLGKEEEQFGRAGWLGLRALDLALRAMPAAFRRRALSLVPAHYEPTAVFAGATEPVHAAALERSFAQYTVQIEGQADILVTGIPYISPYNVGAPLNPLLVQVMGLGYLFHMHRGTPPLKKGGTLVLCHPLTAPFDRRQHQSYVEFFDRVLKVTRDADEMHRRFEPEFAREPRFIEAYRFAHGYHGVHPFYMWYWGEFGRRHVGRVIVAGARDAAAAQRLGFEPAPTLERALAMARESAPENAQVTLMHHPPAFIVDVR